MALITASPRNQSGILLILGSFFLFGVVDTIAKFLTADFHAFQIVFIRQFGFLIAVGVLLGVRGPGLLQSTRPGLQFLRGFLAVASATMFILAVTYVPLADAVAVTFVAPFFVTLMGVVFLGERIGMRRVTAICVGFLGALIVIRPGLGVIHPAAFFALGASMMFALRQVLSRLLTHADGSETTVAWSALSGSALIAVPAFLVWQWPMTGAQIMAMIAIAILAAFAEYLIIRALELAQAVSVAPMHYSMIIWGTLWGYVVFGDFPDIWTWTGTAVIVMSGIYTFAREQRTGV